MIMILIRSKLQVAMVFSNERRDVCELHIHPERSKGAEKGKTSLVARVLESAKYKCLLMLGELSSALSVKEAVKKAKKIGKDPVIIEAGKEACLLFSEADMFHIPPGVTYNIANLSM